MITVTDRKYNKICQLHFGSVGELIAYDDLFEQDLDTGIGIYEFKVDKTRESIKNVAIGCYIFVKDGDITRCFEITRIEEDHNTKIITAEDAGLDLLGESVWPLIGDEPKTLSEYFEASTYDSGWEIGTNEIPNSTKRTIKTEGFETATKRLRRIAKAFDAEMNFSCEFLNDKIQRKLVNFYKRIGSKKKVRLEYGSNISNIKKTESIEHLATALRGYGDGVSLVGFKYNDGRYWVSEDTLHDLQEGERWTRHPSAAKYAGYITDTYQSTAKTQQALFNETLKQLKKRAYPELTYEVDIYYLPEGVNIGDTISIVDNEYNPPLHLEARVSKIIKPLSNPSTGKVTITNITENPDSISEKVQRLSVLVKERLFDFTEVPFVLELKSTSGVVFQNGNIQTKLISTVSKLGTDMTNRFNFRWIRESKYGTNDTEWNKLHETATRELTITSNDVDREAIFICEALENNNVIARNSIVIKDFIVNKSIGPTAPENPSVGDLWTDTSNSSKDVPKIFTNGKWQPVLNKDDEEVKRLQKEFEERTREQANQYTSVMEIINKNEITEDTIRDLTGRFSNMEESYKRLLETADKIEGIGQRTKAVELNMEQSSVLLNAISTYFNYSEDGLLVGKNGQKMQLRITNERMEFIDSGRVVAYVSGQQMNIVSGTFWNTITIANHIFERFNNEFTTISYVGGVNNG